MDSFPFSDKVIEMMTRPHVTLVYAADLDFTDGPVRAHTGTGLLVIDGVTYTGVGSLGNVSTVNEADGSSSPASVTLSLSGWDNDVAGATLQDRCRGRAGKLMLVAIDEDGSYAADILFDGVMDAADLSYGGNKEDNTIAVKLTDQMVLWQRKGTEVWSDSNHRARHDGDRFFFAIAQLSNWPIYWGSKKDAPSFKYS